MITAPQRQWDTLAGLPAWQITEIPRSPGDGGGQVRDEGVAQRVAALMSASACRAPVAVGWLREVPGGPVRVLAAGPGLCGGRENGQAVLTLPAGARGQPLGGGAAEALATLPCWTIVSGTTDVLLAGDNANGQASRELEAPPSLEDGLLSVWLDVFGWVLLADPVPREEINELAAQAAHEQLAAEQNSAPRSRLAARRAGARHDELRLAISAGLWRVRLLAGAASADGARRVAALVCGSADLRGLPYALHPGQETGPLPEMLALTTGQRARRNPFEQAAPAPDRTWWDTPIYLTQPGPQRQWPDPQAVPGAPDLAAASRRADDERDTPVPGFPFTASTRLVAAICRAPVIEVPGLRFRLRPAFDVTPEAALVPAGGTDGAAITAGVVLDRNRVPAGQVSLPLSSLNRHVFVTGATGAGKSQTVRHLLEQAAHAGIPWLVVEPAKAEYRLMAARLPGIEVIGIRPGDLDVPPAGLNPLEPAPGPGGDRFPLQVHADLVRDLFLAAFQADEPFPQVLAAALTRVYEQAGWDLVTGQAAVPGTLPAYPGLEDLQTTAMQVVEDIGYGREVADNVRGFVQVRIASLRLGTSGRFLAGGHPLDFAALLTRNVVLEIEDAGDDHDKAFLMGTVLIRLTEHLRLRRRHDGPAQPGLRHLTVIEEAHRLLRQPPSGSGNGPAAHAVEMFADLLAEVRAYGEGLIIAEQIPSKLIPDVIKNTAVKIVHRLPAADDRDSVGATINLSPAQSEYLVTLRPGEAAVHADGMDYPLLVQMPDGTAAETARPASTATPAQVITARSPSCDPLCKQDLCTLGQIRAAQNTTRNDPAITLWAELAVLGALTGWPAPAPGPGLTARLLDLPDRNLGCALSHAVDAAVAARTSFLGVHADPAALAMQVTAILRDLAASGRPCPQLPPQWMVPVGQWNQIVNKLDEHVRAAGPDSPPHPDTSTWAGHYGQLVPGATSGEQLATARASRDAAWTELTTAQRRALVFGARDPSAIEKAVGGHEGEPRWRNQATAAMTATFADGGWALTWLAPRRSTPSTRTR